MPIGSNPAPGAARRYTMADIGYDDPILLAQLNGDYVTSQYGPIYTPAAGLSYSGVMTTGPVTPGVPTVAGTPPPISNPGITAEVAPTGQSIISDILTQVGTAAATAAGTRITGAIANLGTSPPCTPGYHKDLIGNCVSDSPTAILPGGTPYLQPTSAAGSFGLPSFAPTTVGTINGKPILRCPKRTVLGIDNKCYVKGSLPRQWRKWAPAPRPILSAHDGKVLRQASGLRKKVKKAATGAGLHMTTKTQPRPARKK